MAASSSNSSNITRGLSVRDSNQNGGLQPKLTRQIGKSNLRIRNEKVPLGEIHQDNNVKPYLLEIENDVPKALAKSRTLAVPVRKPLAVQGTSAQPKFEIYKDDDDEENRENNVIAMLERKVKQQEKISKPEEKPREEEPKPTSAPSPKLKTRLEVRKPLAVIDSRGPSSDAYDYDESDDEVFSLQSDAQTGLSDFSQFNVDDDSQSTQYGSALDEPALSEYMTALTGTKELKEDILYCLPEFSADIMTYQKMRERHIRIKRNYMTSQKDINPEMRMILVDWLSDVTEEYKLHQETFHLSVMIVDRTLSKCSVERNRLQLVGATAMMIASKFEEIFPPELKEFVYITDDTYNTGQLISMERYLLRLMDYDIAFPTAQWFGSRFAKIQNANKRTEHAMKYLLDLTLMGLEYLAHKPSLIAASALCYANILVGGAAPWSQEMESETGISSNDMRPVLNLLQVSFRDAPEGKFRSICTRYGSADLDDVTAITPPDLAL